MIQRILKWYWRGRYERACRRAGVDHKAFIWRAVLDGRRDAGAYKRGLQFVRDPLVVHKWKMKRAAIADKERQRQFILADAFTVTP